MLSLAFLVCVLCSVLVWIKYGRDKSNIPLPPAFPGKLPLVGHTFTLFRYLTDLHELIKYAAEDCAKKGGVTHFYSGSELYYVILDPQDALTAANACLTKHFTYKLGNDWMGGGLIITSGDIWKRHRKLLNPAFTLPVIYGFLDVFNSQSKKLVRSMEPHVGKGLFDHFPYMKNNAFETLCAGTFGINAIDDKEFTQKYMESVNEMLNIETNKAVKFWLHNDFLYKLTGLKKKEEEVIKSLHAMANTVLQKKKAAMKNEALNNTCEFESTGIKYKAFLDLLLELSKNGLLTDREIREELDNIIVAGYETTSYELTFALGLLGAHPEVQEKLYKELIEVVGSDKDVEKDDVNKLVYTNAVLMECLRMFPSVPLFIRYVDKDVRLKNYIMRAGSNCLLFPLTSHHDQSWGAHADQFRPERWLDGDLRNNKEFAAFGLGKRACIGRTYAMVSMKVTLAHLLLRYRVKADISKIKQKYEIIMRPLSGHEISIERRT
ncbi:hypothetical protein PYW08_009495 [Mythimna loreyi]|uniref:Uncharacterized protein n=1 Tax=Mythimna loreyi TaxID=667449 RepID=A0ACC2Q681_9NEOP|nr:hypothetical protein PYW08_009495 [Mythimna loreyi]